MAAAAAKTNAYTLIKGLRNVVHFGGETHGLLEAPAIVVIGPSSAIVHRCLCHIDTRKCINNAMDNGCRRCAHEATQSQHLGVVHNGGIRTRRNERTDRTHVRTAVETTLAGPRARLHTTMDKSHVHQALKTGQFWTFPAETVQATD
jgi:hypothetical protein